MTLTRRGLLAGAGALALASCSGEGEEVRADDVTVSIPPQRQPELTVSVHAVPEFPGRGEVTRRVHGRTVVDVVMLGDPRIDSWDLLTGRKMVTQSPATLAAQRGFGRIRGTAGRSRPLVLLESWRARQRTITAMDARTGRQVWTHPLKQGQEVEREVVGDDDRVYLGIHERYGSDKVRAVRVADGRTLWESDAARPLFLKSGLLGVNTENEWEHSSVSASTFLLLDARTGERVSLPAVPGGLDRIVIDRSVDDFLAAGPGPMTSVRAAFDLRRRRWVESPFEADVVGRDDRGRVMFAMVWEGVMTWVEGEESLSVVTLSNRRTVSVPRAKAIRGGAVWWGGDEVNHVIDRSGRALAELPTGEQTWWRDDLVSFGRTFHRVRTSVS